MTGDQWNEFIRLLTPEEQRAFMADVWKLINLYCRRIGGDWGTAAGTRGFSRSRAIASNVRREASHKSLLEGPARTQPIDQATCLPPFGKLRPLCRRTNLQGACFNEGPMPLSLAERPRSSGHRCIRDRWRTGFLLRPIPRRGPSSQSLLKRIIPSQLLAKSFDRIWTGLGSRAHGPTSSHRGGFCSVQTMHRLTFH